MWQVPYCQVCLAFSYTSIFMFGWMFWIFEFTIGSMGFLCMNHRKLYDIKVKHQWFAAEGADIVVIDIGASAKAEEKRIPAVWHLPAVVILAWLCFLPVMRRWVQEEAANILVPGMALLTAGLFWVLHIWTNRRRCDAYSEIRRSIQRSMSGREECGHGSGLWEHIQV